MVALLLVGAVRVVAASGVDFHRELGPAKAQARQRGVPVVVVFAAVWCPVCRQAERVTLRSPEVLAVAGRFEWLRVDVDREPEMVRRFDVHATPTFVVLDPATDRRRVIVGSPEPGALAGELTTFLDASSAPAGEGSTAVYPHADLIALPSGFRSAGVCVSSVGYGPLRLRSQSPLQSLRLAIAPRTPSTLVRGQTEVHLGATWSNVWAVEDDLPDPDTGTFGTYQVDYESLHTSLSVGYGATDNLQVELEVENRSRFGGVMDGFIEGFHDVFGLGQSGRDLAPRDDFLIYADPATGQPPVRLDRSAKGTFARNLVLSLQHNVTCGGPRWPAFSWAVTGRWPLEDSPDLEGDGLDLALSAAASRRFGNLYVYLTLGWARYASESARGIPLADSQMSVLGALEWRAGVRYSLLVQVLASEGQANVPSPFSDWSHEVTLGVKGELWSGGVVELGLIENVIAHDNSPDFGAHLAVTQRF